MTQFHQYMIRFFGLCFFQYLETTKNNTGHFFPHTPHDSFFMCCLVKDVFRLIAGGSVGCKRFYKLKSHKEKIKGE